MSIQTTEALDLLKENVQPLRQGRKASKLETVVQVQTNVEVQQQLRRERERFESLIRSYEGDDPLQPFWEYANWLEQSYPKQGPESNLVPLLEDSIIRFKDVEKYKQDQRFVQIIIKYINHQSNPLELYQMAFKQGLGTQTALLYIAWADELDIHNDFKRADKVFQLGVKNRAQPLTELKEAHMQFQLSFGRRMLRGEIAMENDTKSTNREVLSSLKSTSSSRTSKGPAGVLKVTSNEKSVSNAAKGPVKVYEEDECDGKIVDEIRCNGNKLPKGTTSNKENVMKPGKWCGQKQKQIFETYQMPVNTVSTFKVHEDGNDQCENRKMQTIVNVLKPRKEERRCPVAIFEEPNPNVIPMYPKHLVYAGGTEFSLEELMADKYWKNVKMQGRAHEEINGSVKKCSSTQMRPVQDEETLRNSLHSSDILSIEQASNVVVLHNRTERVNDKISEQKLTANGGEKNEMIGMKSGNTSQKSETGIHNTAGNKKDSSIGSVTRNDKSTSVEKEFSIRFDGANASTFPSPSASFTVNTRNAMNVVQQMWTSPSPRRKLQWSNRKESQVSARKSAIEIQRQPFEVFVDDHCRATESLPPPRPKPSVPFSIFVDEPKQPEQQDHSKQHFAVFVDDNKILDENDANDEVLAVPLPKMQHAEIEELPYVPPPPDDNQTPLEPENKENNATKLYTLPKDRRRTIGVLVPSEDVKIANPNDTDDDDDDEIRGIPKETDLDDATCTTKAFAFVLPSSTPCIQSCNRTSKLVRNSMTDGSYTGEDSQRQQPTSLKKAAITDHNLSVILEASKERYSSSSGSSASSGVSKTFALSEKKKSLAIIEERGTEDIENSIESAMRKSNMIAATNLGDDINPFSERVIEIFLKRASFPQKQHSEGYAEINGPMPLLKVSSSFKIGNDKWVIVGEIGKGAYARILKAQLSTKPSEILAVKQQKPASRWEWYIVKELHLRLSNDERFYFMNFSHAFIYNNGSLLLSKYAQYGTILDFVNKFKLSRNSTCPMAVCVYFSIQMVSAIQYLHRCQIIHADVKPDNFVINALPNISKPCIQLIDFGRSIDMMLFPYGTSFNKVVTTEGFQCNEMRENKPWTYQTDLFGLASTMYVLLVGEYMKTIKQNGIWMPSKPLPRYVKRDFWDPLFSTLLNIPSCSEMPDLEKIKTDLGIFQTSFDQHHITQQFATVVNVLTKK